MDMEKKNCYDKCAKKTLIGGQALIEGIYMRGPDKTATVIRKPDGTHVVREKAYKPAKKKCPIFGWPFIRGIFIFGGSIKDGVSELMYSAENSEIEDTEPTKFDLWVEKKIGAEKAEKILLEAEQKASQIVDDARVQAASMKAETLNSIKLKNQELSKRMQMQSAEQSALDLKAAEQKADELKASVEGKRKEAVDAVMAMLN